METNDDAGGWKIVGVSLLFTARIEKNAKYVGNNKYWSGSKNDGKVRFMIAVQGQLNTRKTKDDGIQ